MMYVFRTAVLLFITLSSLIAQETRIYTNTEDLVLIDEFLGMVSDVEDKVKISSLNSKSSWPKEYQQLDIELNDEILFINGNRIKTSKAFKTEYDKLKSGDKIELGIKRGTERFIVSFKRTDVSKVHRKIMSMPAGADLSKQNISVEDGKIMMNGKEVNPDSLEKMGIKIKKMETGKKKEDDK